MNIITEYVRPPVPSTKCDWMAYIEGEEEGVTGRGPTELEALRNLAEQLADTTLAPASLPAAPQEAEKGQQPTIAEVLDWAASLATAEDPRTSDWRYDDPYDLAKAIRKGPEAWDVMMNGTTNTQGNALLALSHQMDDEAEEITTERVYEFATHMRVLLGVDGADTALSSRFQPFTKDTQP